MKTGLATFAAAFVVAAAALLPLAARAQAFSLASADIPARQPIAQAFAFNGFGCTGRNVSPELSWHGAPAGTKSFAVMVHDPDAVTGGAGFWHWVVIDLPASVRGLPQDAGASGKQPLPQGAREIATDFGVPGWGGPCPPAGDRPHHYRFTVYALGVERLELPANATASLAGFMVNANSLGKASFTATYGR